MADLPVEILEDLTQMCGGVPSPRLQRIVEGYLRSLHSLVGGPPNPHVLALACAICRDVNAAPKPVVNPFAGTPRGTPLEVLRVDSKEVYGVGFLMSVGEGVNGALVQVAMFDSEEEAAWFPFDQVRLRDKKPAVIKPSAPQAPIVVIPDAPEVEEPETVLKEQSAKLDENTIDADEEDEDSHVDDSVTLAPDADDAWLLVEDGKQVWMEDGREGEFRGIDKPTGLLRVSINGVHQGNKFSLYLPDQVRMAEEIPVEHDPVDVGEKELPDRDVNPYALEKAGS